MTLYVDTSALLTVALRQLGHQEVRSILEGGGELFSANLMEAEFRAALRREEAPEGQLGLLSWFRWVLPPRPLSREVERVLDRCYLRGADLWHVACALYLEERVGNGRLSFLSIDQRQREAAEAVGLPTPPSI